MHAFHARVRALAERLARAPDVDLWLAGKRRRRARDEEIKPLNAYRKEELARSYRCFFGEDRSYHEARRALRPQARRTLRRRAVGRRTCGCAGAGGIGAT